MKLDLAGLEGQILTLLAGLILSGILLLGKRLSAWLNIKLSDAQKAALEDAADKALAFGISQAQTTIAAKGWDHITVRNQVIGLATNYAVSRFGDTLKASGVDTSSIDAAAQSLQGILQRKFPDAVAIAAASPATPSADIVAQASLPISPSAQASLQAVGSVKAALTIVCLLGATLALSACAIGDRAMIGAGISPSAAQTISTDVLDAGQLVCKYGPAFAAVSGVNVIGASSTAVALACTALQINGIPVPGAVPAPAPPGISAMIGTVAPDVINAVLRSIGT